MGYIGRYRYANPAMNEYGIIETMFQTFENKAFQQKEALSAVVSQP